MTVLDWLYQNAKDYRREHKFIVSPNSPPGILTRSIHILPEIYPPRTVNTIYFDTPDYKLYQDNSNGCPNRFKARLRWYGEKQNSCPVFFEFKIRRGSAGAKVRFALGTFDPKYFENAFNLRELMRSGDWPQPLQWVAGNCEPALRTVYRRKYLQASEEVRITIDHDLHTSRFLGGQEVHNGSASFNEEFPLIEVKHPAEMAVNLTGLMPLWSCRVARYSKYASGLEAYSL